MKIRHLLIKNFRGIKELDWHIKTDFICLVGPCDSSKTTVLDALEYALSPSWNLTFEDADFYDLNVENDIRIEVTIDELPKELLSEQRYGLYLRGWNDREGLIDEPVDGFSSVLTIALHVKKDLEPSWLIVNERMTEEKRISAKDRSVLGMSRLGGYVSRHLGWGQGSVLNKLLDTSADLQAVLSTAGREIRKSITFQDIEHIVNSVKKITELGARVGVVAKNKMKAHLDIKHIALKESAISLHDGDVPLRLSGTGTQRLLAIALQLAAVREGSLGLIDEIEYGLEPHRICQLLRTLKDTKGQVFLTTHSPSVIQELSVENIYTLNVIKDKTEVRNFKETGWANVQQLARSSPHAFLVRRIIVCEGNTEQGFLRGLDQKEEEKNQRGMWSYGAVSVDGKGGFSIEVAQLFKGLEYDVVWFGDSDVEEINSKKQILKDAGIQVIDWEDSLNTEARIFKDLPWSGVVKVLDHLIICHGQEAIRDQTKNEFKGLPGNYKEWKDSEGLRSALGKTAHKKGWFKNITNCEEVGKVVHDCLSEIGKTDLAVKIDKIRNWIKANE